MSNLVEVEILTHFKHRYQMRLELFKLSIDGGSNPNIDELKNDLDAMRNATWQELYEFQERFFTISIGEYQMTVDKLQTLEVVHKTAKTKPLRKKKVSSPPDNQPEQEPEYSTRALEAMQTAIQKFWLDYDAKKPPTQKMVSNFIAEQLGEPIRNRFSDELARAIKPDTI